MWWGGGRHTCVSHTASIMHAPDFNNVDEAALNTFILTQVCLSWINIGILNTGSHRFGTMEHLCHSRTVPATIVHVKKIKVVMVFCSTSKLGGDLKASWWVLHFVWCNSSSSSTVNSDKTLVSCTDKPSGLTFYWQVKEARKGANSKNWKNNDRKPLHSLWMTWTE